MKGPGKIEVFCFFFLKKKFLLGFHLRGCWEDGLLRFARNDEGARDDAEGLAGLGLQGDEGVCGGDEGDWIVDEPAWGILTVCGRGGGQDEAGAGA